MGNNRKHICLHAFFGTFIVQMNEPNDPEQIGDESFLTSFARQRRALFSNRKNTTSVRKLNSKAFPQLEQSDYLFSSFWCCRCASSSGKLQIETGAHACEKEEYRPWQISTSCRRGLRINVFAQRSAFSNRCSTSYQS